MRACVCISSECIVAKSIKAEVVSGGGGEKEEKKEIFFNINWNKHIKNPYRIEKEK